MGKKSKARLPKQVAGVKIPKKLRKKGGKLLAALDTSLGREVALAGLMTAAAAIARRKSPAASLSSATRRGPAGRGAPHSPRTTGRPSGRDRVFQSVQLPVAPVPLNKNNTYHTQPYHTHPSNNIPP